MNPEPNVNSIDAIARRFIAGDRDAFEYLFGCFAPSVLAFLAGRMALPDAEDFTQSAFVQAWDKRESFNGNGSDFKKWIFAIARNMFFDHVRSAKRRRLVSLGDEHERTEEIDTGERIRREKELKILGDCIKAVGGKFVEAVLRTKYHGVSPEVLAGEEGVTRETIYTRVSRGKMQLRDCMEKKQKP
jgi:RNA polymerase sigma-70 factor (ECF subfamily)